MKEFFGTLPDGRDAHLYTISRGGLTAFITDYGASLVRLLVPDATGSLADVVLGYDDANGYRTANGACIGATVGRSANRLKDSRFLLAGTEYRLTPNEGANNLHSGPDHYFLRLWDCIRQEADALTFRLYSPHGDQGYPGNATVDVTYSLDDNGGLHIVYDAVSDRDTVFNLTNHSYFNLAGHDHPEKAMDQILQMNATFFNPDDALSIPNGELRSVEGTPMDFRTPKAIGADLGVAYDALELQGGYDHNFEAKGEICATVTNPESGRVMEVLTDCDGIQFYCGNFLQGEIGKDGVSYCYRGGIALETQYLPDSVNHPEWHQPFYKAGQPYHSETIYRFR